MKSKFYALGLATLGFFQLNAQESKPYASKSFDISTIKSSRAETSGGNINVEGGTSGGKAIIEMYVKPNGMGSLSAEEIKEKLKDYEIKMELNGSELYAKARKKTNGWRNGINVSFRVIVPKNVEGDYGTSGGNINIKDFNAEQKVSTSGGNIKIQNLTAGIKGNTSGGNIVVVNCKNDINVSTSGGNVVCENSDGTADLETSGGSITITSFKGKVNASTSGGNVKIADSDAVAKLSTSGGSIRASHHSGSLVASTSGGNIEVEMDKVKGDVDLETTAGHIDIDIPMNVGYNFDLEADRIEMSSNIDIKGKMSIDKSGTDYVNGTYKGGGHLIKAEVSSGRIKLKN